MRKKPLFMYRGAHGGRYGHLPVQPQKQQQQQQPGQQALLSEHQGAGSVRSDDNGNTDNADAAAALLLRAQQRHAVAQPVLAGVDTPGWVQSLSLAPGSDLLASGAGDGVIRLWQITPNKTGGAAGLEPLGCLPAPGYVNGLALGRSGRLCVAALGQEPRMGRWGRDAGARNGLLVQRWELNANGDGDDDDDDG